MLRTGPDLPFSTQKACQRSLQAIEGRPWDAPGSCYERIAIPLLPTKSMEPVIGRSPRGPLDPLRGENAHLFELDQRWAQARRPQAGPVGNLFAAERFLAEAGVSPLFCTGVSSLYCSYKQCRRKIEMSPGVQSRNDTPPRERRDHSYAARLSSPFDCLTGSEWSYYCR